MTFVLRMSQSQLFVCMSAAHVASFGTNSTPLRSREGARWFGSGAFPRRERTLSAATARGDSTRREAEKRRVLTGREKSHLLARVPWDDSTSPRRVGRSGNGNDQGLSFPLSASGGELVRAMPGPGSGGQLLQVTSTKSGGTDHRCDPVTADSALSAPRPV